ncbi:DMT family transporter [Devosia sp. 1566]|uniref:DMT family transporter n=1 Tax=Devosia sp. 1566 TaxID=2499144 RepID=UPI000FDC26C2|nr:DMT family transporter [Devosia sp. 1566]
MSARYWALIIFIGSIWGTSFLFNAVLIRELGPITVAAGRVTIAALVSWLLFFALRKPLPRDPMLYLKLGLLGVFSYAVPFTLFPISQAHIPSGLAAIINALLPVVTVLVSHYWPGGEKIKRHKAAGVVAGFTGAALLASPSLAAGNEHGELWAIAVCFAAVMLYAITLNVARSFKAIEPTTIATIAISGAALTSVPVALWVEGVPHIERIETWAAWIAIGVFCTALAFQLMYRLLPRVGTTNFASNTFVTPVVAVLLGVSLLGESIRPIHLLGMGVVFLGLLLIDGRILKIWRKPVSGTEVVSPR